ncbi:MAG: hypothetical protein EXQ86_12205 [Rhodospirillales bacterium]|nr:hypothetical protein [Rhodospirillales bacterium]
MPTISYKMTADADAVARRVYETIRRTYGLDEPRGIYLLMGHTPDHLAPSWERSRSIYGKDSAFTVKIKHLLTLGISATNNCEYCCRSHTTRLRQLGATDADLLEALMVVDTTNGESKFAEGTRVGENPVLPPPDAEILSPEARRIVAEIEQVATSGAALYRLMAYDPGYLSASWKRRRACFGEEGHLGLRLKHMIAYTVAAAAGSDYVIEAHSRRLRELGLTAVEMAELLFIVDVVCGYNRYVQGVQVDPLEGQRKPWGQHAQANKAPSCSG